MRYFAGLDVSLEETAICVVDETGHIVKETRAASDPEVLAAALRRLDLPLARVGLEACSLSSWLHDGLCSEDLPAICIETRHANATMKAMPNKTDRNDARALAQIMRTGWYRQVHVKSRSCRLWRSLLASRRTVLNEMRTIENGGAGHPSGSRCQARHAEPQGLCRQGARAGRRGSGGHAAGRAASFDSCHHARAARASDQTGSRHHPRRGHLPPAHEHARCRRSNDIMFTISRKR